MFYKTILFLLLIISNSLVAEVTVIEPLSFGKIAVANNTSASSLTITQNNTIQSTNHLFVIIPGSRAELFVENFGANIALNINATVTGDFTHNQGLNGANFNLVNLDFPSVISTDIRGQALFFIGGTLQTSGDGSAFFDGGYQATVAIDVTF